MNIKNFTPRLICILLSASSLLLAGAENRQNPVLWGVADAGVIRWAGKYYLGGVGTNGDLHISTDLIHWNDKKS